jgi:hypothetical protein
MLNRKLLGLVVSAAALAASAVPAGAATPHPADPHADAVIGVVQPPPASADGAVVNLQMPGGSTWGNYAPPPRAPGTARLQDVDTEI